ncbi:hypothetical protein BKA69DRAFT_556859 [Paraphysoderma sedebokerense]|nr:hypothetical protein BKA69DRAFT_556859 [Paraphysoderma sedebokerense]
MCRQRENQNAVDIRAINRKLGILLSDGSREDKFLALQYLSKDLNLSKSCSNDDEAKAYEKAYKLMIELDKSPDQAMKLLECLGDYYLNERSNAETAALWKSGLAYFRKKGDIARAKKCRAMIDEIPGAIDDLKLSDIDLDDFFSPMDVSENMEDVERSYVISIHGKTFTINVDATMAVADAIKLIQNEYQDRFGREPIIDELQTNKGVPLSAHSILARVVSANNQLSALSSVFAHELYQKECQKTDTKAMDQVTQCLRVGDETILTYKSLTCRRTYSMTPIFNTCAILGWNWII